MGNQKVQPDPLVFPFGSRPLRGTEGDDARPQRESLDLPTAF